MAKQLITCLAAIAMVVFSGVQAQGQEASASPKSEKEMKVVLDADGNLVGNVFADVDGERKPVEAKMTLIREGVKVKSVYADEKGSFSFGEVVPGKYKVTGAAASYVGMSPVVVAPAAAAAIQESNSFVLASPSYSSGSVMSYSSAPSYGGGGGGFGGGGRLLGNRRLLRLGLIGGIVAIAAGDSSPDQ